MHFPGGCPRRTLSVILAHGSSDFPQEEPFGALPRLRGLQIVSSYAAHILYATVNYIILYPFCQLPRLKNPFNPLKTKIYLQNDTLQSNIEVFFEIRYFKKNFILSPSSSLFGGRLSPAFCLYNAGLRTVRFFVLMRSIFLKRLLTSPIYYGNIIYCIMIIMGTCAVRASLVCGRRALGRGLGTVWRFFAHVRSERSAAEGSVFRAVRFRAESRGMIMSFFVL